MGQAPPRHPSRSTCHVSGSCAPHCAPRQHAAWTRSRAIHPISHRPCRLPSHPAAGAFVESMTSARIASLSQPTALLSVFPVSPPGPKLQAPFCTRHLFAVVTSRRPWGSAHRHPLVCHGGKSYATHAYTEARVDDGSGGRKGRQAGSQGAGMLDARGVVRPRDAASGRSLGLVARG